MVGHISVKLNTIAKIDSLQLFAFFISILNLKKYAIIEIIINNNSIFRISLFSEKRKNISHNIKLEIPASPKNNLRFCVLSLINLPPIL